MEKIQKGSPEYFLIEKEFKSVIENITREKNYSKFIGGLPITLERKDIFTILTKDLSGNYRYSATQKVDGTRLLLFANYKKSSGFRNITFIDRNNDFYTLKNRNRDLIPDFDGPRLLIDGELVTYSVDNNVITPTDQYYNIKMFSFMAFDILYGPITIEYSGPPNNKRLNIGSEGAMSGPLGGKMWSYQKRYDILYQLLVPNELNDFRPILSLAFKECKWIVPEIKPIYFINALKNKLVLYKSDDNKAFFQSNLIQFRSVFYKLINDHVRKEIQYRAELINVKLDGLIFTPFDTEYIIGGPWKKFLNVQYKWKPINEQTIDFAIFKESGKYILKIKKGTGLETFTVRKQNNYVPATISEKTINDLTKSKTRDNTIGEFKYNPITLNFELEKIRTDKTTPNALNTAINVMNAIKNPVDLEIIKQFFFIHKLNENGLKLLLKYMSKSQMLRCMINNDKLKIFNSSIEDQVSKLLDIFKKSTAHEFEIRFGIIEPQKFQPNLPFNLYKQFIDIANMIYSNTKSEYSVFHDMYLGSVRTRYIYIENLGTYAVLASIKKEPIQNVNIDLKYLYNLDIRYSLSNEKPVTEKVTAENADLILKKKRHTFNFEIFSLDCTEISKIVKNKQTGKETSEAPKYQIELELKQTTLSNDVIIQKINKVMKNILGLINS